MGMSKKDFISAANMVKEIWGKMARESRNLNQCEKGDYHTGFDNAMIAAQDIVLDEMVRFCKAQQSPGGMGFNEWRFRGYVEGLCGPNGGEVKKGKG